MLSSIPTPILLFLAAIASRWDWFANLLSGFAINLIISSTPPRPHPWSTFSDYISWQGLTDRTFQGRHLPVSPSKGLLPAESAIAALFTRPANQQRLSNKSTCLFPAFAQYLTDGFIRTDVSHDKDAPPAHLKRRKTTTNHEIDLCPLYGRTPGQTQVLRLASEAASKKGLLKSQVLNGEEFALFLYLPGGVTVDPQFLPSATSDGLDPPLGIDNQPPDALASIFAFGGDRANATPFVAMVNTLLLREHNRLAGELETRNPGWDDERVFQTARNILIVMFIRIVVEEYINHINPLPFRLKTDPTLAWKATWNRPNWITAEFSLLYRWHSLIPDQIQWPSGPINMANFPRDNRPLLNVGLFAAFAAAAGQPAAELGAFNTDTNLIPLETLAVDQARLNELASYNDYRQQFKMPRAKTFADISSDPAIQAHLAGLYATPDDVEFYPGLFAEDRIKNSPLPGLLLTMVAVDAFSQALTNPLLSEQVYPRPDTFTPWGSEQIGMTSRLEDMLRRNTVGAPQTPSLHMTQASWRYSS